MTRYRRMQKGAAAMRRWERRCREQCEQLGLDPDRWWAQRYRLHHSPAMLLDAGAADRTVVLRLRARGVL